MPTLGDIVARFGGELVGDADRVIARIAPLADAEAGDLAFLSNAKYRRQLADTRAGAVIMAPPGEPGLSAILTPNPYLYYARVSQWLHPAPAWPAGVHPTAVVLGTVADDASIGPNVFVGAGASVARGAQIGPNVVIMDGASIGEDTRLHANVTVHARCVVGDRCVLHSGVVLGGDGFGYARDEAGQWVGIPQVGRAVIGNDVDIGANTCIDRGALGDTVIGNGVKLDNLIQIAHNVQIGEHTAIAGCTGIAGSTVIGKRCTIGGAAIIIGHLQIDDEVHVGAGAVISKHVKRGSYSSSLPTMEHAQWLKNFAHLRHLDAMADKIRRLEQRLDELEQRQ